MDALVRRVAPILPASSKLIVRNVPKHTILKEQLPLSKKNNYVCIYLSYNQF